jgi:hypothetical protein
MVDLRVIFETQQETDHDGNKERAANCDHEFLALSFALQITPRE